MSALLTYGGLVVGGSATSDVEIIDISGKQLLCSKPPNHPKNLRGIFGTFYHGEVMICGGYDQGTVSDECYKYYGERRYTIIICSVTKLLIMTWGGHHIYSMSLVSYFLPSE